MADYVYPMVLMLIAGGAEKLDPEGGYSALAAPYLRPGKRVPLAAKRQLLDRAIERIGPAALLTFGQGVKEANDEPIGFTLLNSRDPAGLVAKLQKLEGYLHSRHRLRVTGGGERHLEIEHFSRSAEPPSPADNLFTCGLLAALFEVIGCDGVVCRLPRIGDGGKVIYRGAEAGRHADIPPVDLADGPFDTWRFEWRALQPRQEAIGGLDDYIIGQLQPLDRADPLDRAPGNGAAAEVRRVVERDLARGWRVGDVAAEIGASVRSVQRALASEGRSFSAIHATARAEQAARLLGGSDLSLTQIGYCCGFSDSAHFTREFKKSYGSTPSVFRREARLAPVA